ncbi:MAG: TfoX/Sxy family protein [Anaerolineae bacterium]|jgi:DNA transformation protein and related proteins|nr:TfoX/Sxy family protein [Anaerolineae bacterium]MBT7326364.1 TfoX/Sxy family protein [Anaerolineae bacterium]
MSAKEENSLESVVTEFVGRIFPLREITTKKMFGGYGVFEEGTMFALITAAGGVHLKVDDSNRPRFEEAGAGKHGRMPYYQIPKQIFDDDTQLLAWTQEAIAVSKAAKK